MGSLYDHAQGGKYLPIGKHLCKVVSQRMFEFNSGNPGVEFTVRDAQQREGKIGFVLVEKAYWRLANFAKACGLDDKELRTYDPENEQHHKRLIGKKFVAVVEKPEKYSEIVDFEQAAIGGEPAPATAPKAKPAAVEEPSIDPNEIPF